MCGRFNLTASPAQICETYGIDRVDEYKPSNN